jgi:carbamoyltransferase
VAAAQLLADGKIIGWFSGGSELGPRSLGQRSILCDPRREDAKDILNARVKHRESFRPFAPSVLFDCAHDWFELDQGDETPFMLRVAGVRKERRHQVPAITHVDGTARPQTVHPDANRDYFRLIKHFEQLTGIPMILNTSFNVMGEPIVETPADAVACLKHTGLDACVFENGILMKENAVLAMS